MRLNYDCLRSVLLAIEDYKYIQNDFSLNNIDMFCLLSMDKLAVYNKEDIVYTVIICTEGGLIDCDIEYADNTIDDFSIHRLTYDGHLFIESIRESKTWDNIKSICKKLGVISVNMIKNIAAKVLLGLIDKYFIP